MKRHTPRHIILLFRSIKDKEKYVFRKKTGHEQRIRNQNDKRLLISNTGS